MILYEAYSEEKFKRTKTAILARFQINEGEP